MPRYCPTHQRNGFTLIEVLVAVSIMIALMSGAIASYRIFVPRQQVLQSARNAQQAFLFAQKKARVGEKPSGCNTLRGYAVRGNISATSLNIYAVCVSGEYLVTNISFVGTARLEQNVNVTLKVLTGGTATGSDVTVIITNTAYRYSFVVHSGGGISEGGYL